MPQFATTSSRWAALQSRDPAAASAFIYCVTTTKIYCRPNCPSRLARRANIVFYDTLSDAEADGFRPCKRCRPEVMENDGDSQKLAVAKACKLLQEDIQKDGKLSVKGLAAQVGLTECHFCRVFKKVMGVTVGQYKGQLASMRVVDDGRAMNSNGTLIPTSDSHLDSVIASNEFDFLPTPNPFAPTDLDLVAADLDFTGSEFYETNLVDLEPSIFTSSTLR